jgi:hypothetical protein
MPSSIKKINTIVLKPVLKVTKPLKAVVIMAVLVKSSPNY